MEIGEMSKKTKKKSAKPTPEQIEKAKQEAAKKLAEQQQWLDAQTKDMTDIQRDEIFRHVSRSCKGTVLKDGKIVLVCPIPAKLVYCVSADSFKCANGTAASAKGCKLDPQAASAMNQDGTCIDGAFITEAEGGSYLSPYVPWGPIQGDGKGNPKLTTGNGSGVTLGTGVDLGAVQSPDAYLKELEKQGVSQATRDTIKPFLGKKKEAACQALREAKSKGPLVLPQSDVALIDRHAMQSRVPQLTKQFDQAKDKRVAALQAELKKERAKKTPIPQRIAALERQAAGARDFSKLTCPQQTVLFSTYYHEGNIAAKRTKPLVDACIDGDEDAVKTALTNKSKNANPLIAGRGAREFGYMYPPPPSPPPPKPKPTPLIAPTPAPTPAPRPAPRSP
jgi:hypothetical protein